MTNLIEMTDHEVLVLKEGLDLFKTMILAERRDGWGDFEAYQEDMVTAKGLEAKLDESAELAAMVQQAMVNARTKVEGLEKELRQNKVDTKIAITLLGGHIKIQDEALNRYAEALKRSQNPYIA